MSCNVSRNIFHSPEIIACNIADVHVAQDSTSAILCAIWHATISGLGTKMHFSHCKQYCTQCCTMCLGLKSQSCVITSIDIKVHMFHSVTYIKNCDPLVFGPLLAMDNSIGLSCFSWKHSSVILNIQKIMQFIIGHSFSRKKFSCTCSISFFENHNLDGFCAKKRSYMYM